MLLIPPLEQFVAGIAAALIVCSVLRWTPIARNLLIALVVAGMLNLLVPDHNLPSAGDHDFIPLRIARELIGYPLLQPWRGNRHDCGAVLDVPPPLTPGAVQ
jgi:hypothetical protein